MNGVKFLKDERIVQLSPNIYLLKDFFDIEIANKYLSILESYSDNDWLDIHANYEDGDINNTFWGDKCSKDIISVSEIHDKLIDFLAPTHWTFQHLNFIRLKENQESPTFFSNGDFCAEYKIAWYLGNFTGGEIVFPDLNFEYKPEHNDILIFKITKNSWHKTSLVTSGIRYVYSDYILPHPGYFMP